MRHSARHTTVVARYAGFCDQLSTPCDPLATFCDPLAESCDQPRLEQRRASTHVDVTATCAVRTPRRTGSRRFCGGGGGDVICTEADETLFNI